MKDLVLAKLRAIADAEALVRPAPSPPSRLNVKATVLYGPMKPAPLPAWSTRGNE
jgi:hypothetical protein